MNKKRATSVLYLCFSILVAFFNALAGDTYYFIFCAPFLGAIAIDGKASRIAEFLGLIATSIAILFAMDISIGIVVLATATSLFYTISIEKKHVYPFIAFGAIIVYVAAFINPSITSSRVVYSFMYAAVFIVTAFCHYVYVKEVRAKDPKNCPLEQKYIDLIDQLSEVAHESIDTLKKLQDGKL